MSDDPPACPATDRFIDVEDGFRVWTRSLGGDAADAAPPLLVLHGGPGVPHDYLENLEALASPRQKVVFYDQLGCGRSDRPDAPARWQLPRFVAEIDRVRDGLGLDRVVLLGQSWGGMLAIEYLLGRPSGVAGLILSNSTASAPLFAAEARRLLTLLPAEIQETVRRCEVEQAFESADYQAAMMAFYVRHVIRVPMPAFVARSFAAVGQPYFVMWGKSEFTVTGNLRTWDRTGRLGEIALPVLLISGEHDESTPLVNQRLKDGLPDARWHLLQGCSHLSHVEAPETYFGLVKGFLDSLLPHRHVSSRKVSRP